MQLRVRHIARNVIFNWMGMVANIAIAFFLSPFILHRLGNTAYAVWVLAVSAIAYLGFLDLGMQSSVLRFVSKGHTQQRHDEASDAISAALWVRLQMCCVILIVTGGLAWAFPHFFVVPPNLITASRIAVVLIGLSTAITMSVGVAGAVSSGLNRYDLQNYVRFVQSGVRAVAVVVVLTRGDGIVGLGISELLASIVGNAGLAILAKRLYPELRVHLRRPRREVLGKIWSYSFYVFLTTVAVQLVYQTDTLVVGAFVATAAVTFYAIANNIMRYSSQIINSMSNTFTPAASTYDAAGDTTALINLYRNGTRAMMAVALPLTITLVLRGKTFIRLWMGPSYAEVSGTILILLAAPMFFAYTNYTGASIAFGTEKHQFLSYWAIVEGVANLVLSIILARQFGAYGVAIGTIIPSLFVQLVVWPGYVTRLLGLSRREVVVNVWGPMLALSIPFALCTLAVERLFPVHSLLTFFLQVIATVPVFLACLLLAFRGYAQQTLMPILRTMLT